jgi:hypothetical protein
MTRIARMAALPASRGARRKKLRTPLHECGLALDRWLEEN